MHVQVEEDEENLFQSRDPRMFGLKACSSSHHVEHVLHHSKGASVYFKISACQTT